ncbi:uncharacterized protein LOC110463123 [Mizuhopecten yessoensis]|uniref:Methyltransferase FkbM domain-containing protein n=1 Tax=Mizuhopecten yessoensis TaxID=6573 RepID=A0A210PWS9_MIZYE|nr:uncharacterized protein LOC110463123 [Mizuhopecten yessoensis]OWF40929.1 hypothetical protein KP79_PYT15957 [Mizuhopecten yessoensis]
MYKTMKSLSVLIVISVLAMVVVVSYVYVQYSGPVSNQTKPTKQQETDTWKEIQRQQLQIEQLNQKINRLHSKLNKQRAQPIPKQKQSQPSALEEKQRQLFDSYNNIPVKVYANNYRDKTWTRVPELCQNLAGFQSTKLHTLSGVLDIYIHDPKKDIWVSGALANGQIWESGLVNLILTTLKKEKDAAFLDIGANLGVYSLFAAKQGVNVISIEPLMVNVQRMCTSIRAGHLSDKMTIVRGALSDMSENVTLGIDANNVGGSFVIQNQNENKVKASHVEGQHSDVVMSATLDDLLNLPDFNFSRVVIKMDVEGYEHKVVRGGVEFFDKVAVPTILMEWEFHKGAESGTEIIKFFGSRNYIAYDPMENTFLDSKLSRSWPHEIVWRKKV